MLQLIILLVILVHCCQGSHFFGASFSVAPATIPNKVEISYRVTWTNSACNDVRIASGVLIGGEGNLVCISGCSGQAWPLNFVCLEYSVAENWMTGIGSGILDISSASSPIIMRFSSCCWISLAAGGGSWSFLATASITPRPDTGKINTSPISSVPPIMLFLGGGCKHRIRIPTIDADGDTVRCRWASGFSECGGVCLAFPGATLNETTCTIEYDSTGQSLGRYAVALMLEDFPSSGGSVPFSKNPLQFVVKIISSPLGCDVGPTFIYPTKVDSAIVHVLAGSIYQDEIVAKVNRADASIFEIVMIPPRGTTMSPLASYPNVTGSWSVSIAFPTTEEDLGKSYDFCFYAADSFGVTSELRCYTLYVIEGCLVPSEMTSNYSVRTTASGAVINAGGRGVYYCPRDNETFPPNTLASPDFACPIIECTQNSELSNFSLPKGNVKCGAVYPQSGGNNLGGMTVFTPGFITSPGYDGLMPYNGPKNGQYRFNIFAMNGNGLVFKFTAFDVKNDNMACNNNHGDVVLIYCGLFNAGEEYRFCNGRNAPPLNTQLLKCAEIQGGHPCAVVIYSVNDRTPNKGLGFKLEVDVA